MRATRLVLVAPNGARVTGDDGALVNLDLTDIPVAYVIEQQCDLLYWHPIGPAREMPNYD